MSSTGLQLEDVSVSYRRRGQPELRAVDGVTLRVKPGEVVGLVGESGCGKSTLARAVCGLERIASGSATFDGLPITPLRLRPRPGHMRRIQMVFQNPNASLNPRRVVHSQVEDGRAAHPSGTTRASSVQELLALVGIAPAGPPIRPGQRELLRSRNCWPWWGLPLSCPDATLMSFPAASASAWLSPGR